MSFVSSPASIGTRRRVPEDMAHRGSSLRQPFDSSVVVADRIAAASVGRSWQSRRTRQIRRKEELMKLRNLGVLGAAGLLAVTAAVPAFAQDKVRSRSASTLPLSGRRRSPTAARRSNGVQLAIDQANAAGGVGGYTLEVDRPQDDAVDGSPRPGPGRRGHADPRRGRRPSSASSAPSTRTSRARRSRSPTRPACPVQPGEHARTDLTPGRARAVPPGPIRTSATTSASRPPDDIQGPAWRDYAYTNLGAQERLRRR